MGKVTVTHVLRWVPECERWELLTCADHRTGRVAGEEDRLLWPRDSASTAMGFQALHRWVAERLGWNITLQEQRGFTWSLSKPLRLERHPLYHVWAVTQ